MSSYSSIRAAAQAERVRAALNSSEKGPQTVVNGTEARGSQRPSGYGVNASDRKAGRRSPLRGYETAAPKASRSSEVSRLQVREKESRTSPGTKKPGYDIGRGLWNPQASLVSASNAPLASRVSVPPLASSAPRALQPTPLQDLNLQEQEDAILDDLLFVFMGFEGQYVRFAESYNPLEEKHRLAGPEYRILPGLDPSLRDLASSTLRMASNYVALEAYIEVQSRDECGVVNHALCSSIRRMLKDYLTLVAQLEHQLITDENFTIHLLALHTKSTSNVFMHLYSLAHEILKRNSLLEEDDESEDLEDVDDIIENLKEGKDPGGLAGRKVCKGGAVLGLITRRLSTMAGDPAAKELLTKLLREASRPYMNMLNEWLHQGGIRDPHAEFLIKEQKSIRREGLEQDYTDEYWEKRYTIREDEVPPQLENVKEKVLLAGKYLNVVRECGGVDISTEVKDVPQAIDDPRFLDNVNSAYAHANSSLLELLLTTHALPARLRSLKHYFFLDRSDFFSYFLELTTSELRKPAKSVNTGKLQSLLDIVLRQPGSVAAEDPYKEDVKVSINEVGLTDWLMRIVSVTGIEQGKSDPVNTSFSNLLTPAPNATDPDKDITGFDALVLDYTVPFPLSLVISRVTLTRYQLLFRYLLSLRHLETLLTNCWAEHSKTQAWRHRSSNPKIELWKRKAWTLRARMLVFVQQLLYFCTAEVIEPNWQALMARLNESDEGRPASGRGLMATVERAPKQKRTVDELMQDHVDFLATCLKECMLTNSKLLKIKSKVLNTCTMFCNYTSVQTRHLIASDADLSNPSSTTSKSNARTPATTIAHDPSKLDRLFSDLQKYEDNFSRHLKILLDALNYLAATETVAFLGLCARLSTAGEGLLNFQGIGSAGYG